MTNSHEKPDEQPPGHMHTYLECNGLRRAQEVPLVAQLLAAGGSAQAAERAWLLRLLAAGLRGPADGPLYRFTP